jgi:LacI family transcriptional regulator
MAQPRLAMGEAAATMLLERIDGSDHPARAIEMQAEFISRGSISTPGQTIGGQTRGKKP